ncbi:MAG: CRISPR-associated CARF protein Csa3 [Thermofilum sp.]
MTLFVVTLGFEEKFAVRMITRHGLDKGDRILLVTGPQAAPAKRAASFLSEFVSRYYGGEVAVERVELNPEEGFESLVLAIYRAVSEKLKEGEKAVFNLSGGMRSICLAAFAAAQLLSATSRVEVELETEDSTTLLSIPQPLLQLPKLAKLLSPEKAAILLSLNREKTTAQLAEELRRDATTLSRHLRTLAALHLLEQKHSKPSKYKATPLAALLAETLSRGTRAERQAYKPGKNPAHTPKH